MGRIAIFVLLILSGCASEPWGLEQAYAFCEARGERTIVLLAEVPLVRCE